MWRSKLGAIVLQTHVHMHTLSLSLRFRFRFCIYARSYVRHAWHTCERLCVSSTRNDHTRHARQLHLHVARACNRLCVLNVSVCDLCVLFWLRNHTTQRAAGT